MNSRLLSRWLVLAASVAVSGCAFIAGSTRQPVLVKTIQNNEEIAGVRCTLRNDAGQWMLTSPASVIVEKNYGDMKVECATNGALVGRETVESKSNMLLWGNLLLGHVPAYIVDWGTGAGFDYPNLITVPMRMVMSAAEPTNSSE